MSKDGWYAYTLYIDAGRNIAFVHVLPMKQHDPEYPPYFARCIDLPVGKSGDLLRYYTLALSSDGTTLYAANAALGTVSTISLSDNFFEDDIIKTVHFDPGSVRVTNDDKTRMLHNGAVLSSDQQTLYVVGIHSIWAIDASSLNVRGQYATSQAFTGVALSADDNTLYAVHPASGITFVNVASGQSRQVPQSPVRTPWGIEWISN
jgi:DNA-binding beta-propeller fold protein YncE